LLRGRHAQYNAGKAKFSGEGFAMNVSTDGDLRRRLDADIRGLCQFERGSASEGERQGAEWMASRFREMGLRPEMEEFRFYPDYWTAWGAHAALAALAGAAALTSPRAARGSALVSGLAAASFWGDLTTGYHWIRSLFPARDSYNVLARLPNPQARRVLIISAHLDAAHAGTVFHPAIARWVVQRFGPSRRQGPIMQLPFAAMLTVAGGSLARALGLPRWMWRTPLRVGVVLNMITAAFLADIGRNPVVPGANDDATGIATVLALAHELSRKPPANLEVWFLGVGCEEAIMGGMVAFGRQHFPELASRNPFVLNFEVLGSGKLSVMEGEGFLKFFPYHAEAVGLAAEVAREAAFTDVGSHIIRFGTDALVPTRHGIPAVTIASVNEDGYVSPYHWPTDEPDTIDLGSVERAVAFSSRMIELLDQRAVD
jgi:hypothetical protein